MSRSTRRTSISEEEFELIKNFTDDELRGLEAELKRTAADHHDTHCKLNRRIIVIQEERKHRSIGARNGFKVSDHALIRYMERYLKMDLSAFRQDIAAIAERAIRDLAAPVERTTKLTIKDPVTELIVGVNSVDKTITTLYIDTDVDARFMKINNAVLKSGDIKNETR
jgi:hypothetical protein